jgi:hypothetical protein
MVRYTGKNGKEYVLRFDMSAMEAMKEKYAGGYAEAMKQLNGVNRDIILEIFLILAQAGEEFVAEEIEHRQPAQVSGEGLLSKHSSIGRVRAMLKAVEEAIADGNRMQTKDEEDDQIRDGYLDELREQERKKGKN